MLELVVGSWLVVGGWWLVVGCWLLVGGCWLVVGGVARCAERARAAPNPLHKVLGGWALSALAVLVCPPPTRVTLIGGW